MEERCPQSFSTLKSHDPKALSGALGNGKEGDADPLVFSIFLLLNLPFFLSVCLCCRDEA